MIFARLVWKKNSCIGLKNVSMLEKNNELAQSLYILLLDYDLWYTPNVFVPIVKWKFEYETFSSTIIQCT